MSNDFHLDPIDSEIEELICALNSIPGVTTQASCCGHGNASFYVWLQCSTLESIVSISKIFKGNVLSDDGLESSYTIEVAPYHLMVKNEYQLDMTGKPIVDEDGKHIFCVNLIVTSTDLQGCVVDIGLAHEKIRRKEFQTLTKLAKNMALNFSKIKNCEKTNDALSYKNERRKTWFLD